MTDDQKFKLALARDIIIVLFVVLNFIAATKGHSLIDDKLIQLIGYDQQTAQACRAK